MEIKECIYNSDLNILGSLNDWNLVNVFLHNSIKSLEDSGGVQRFTSIKTNKSIKRFERAISDTLIKFKNRDVESLIRHAVACENFSNDSLLLLFWNASFNNHLLHYLNIQVYFPAFYSGRMAINHSEVMACLKHLREREYQLQKWTQSTLEKVASKYLTLLKKFHLMHGTKSKNIVHPYLNDKMFILFVYWIAAIETKTNLLESEWLKYCFSEKPVFIERLMQKKFAMYFQLNYTGDKLKIETVMPYSTIYHAIK